MRQSRSSHVTVITNTHLRPLAAPEMRRPAGRQSGHRLHVPYSAPPPRGRRLTDPRRPSSRPRLLDTAWADRVAIRISESNIRVTTPGPYIPSGGSRFGPRSESVFDPSHPARRGTRQTAAAAIDSENIQGRAGSLVLAGPRHGMIRSARLPSSESPASSESLLTSESLLFPK